MNTESKVITIRAFRINPAAVLLLAIGTASGCAMDPQPTATAVPIELTHQQQMSADSQYMMQLHERDASPFGSSKIDLADPGQYQFVMNRLAAAGKTTGNSPELFRRLQDSRNRAVALGVNSLSPTDWCAAKIQLGSEKRVGSTITFNMTHPIVSCVGGASYLYADITTYNSNTAGTQNYLVQTAAGEDYSGGTDFTTVSIDPALPAVVGRVNRTDSLVIAYDEHDNEQLTYNIAISYLAPVASSLAIEHPITHDWISNGGNIQICQLRGDVGHCDYGIGKIVNSVFIAWPTDPTGIAAVKAGTGGNTGTAWQGDVNTYFSISNFTPNDLAHVYSPLKGTVDAGATATGNCIIQAIDFAEYDLIKTVSGGICTTTGTFTNSISFPANSRTATFNTLVDFNNNGGIPGPGVGSCSMSIIINEIVKPALRVKMTTTCGPRFASLAPNGGPALPNLIQFLNSCFAKGTRIRRVDGSSTPVELLKAGDKVMSDIKGTALTVIGISHGNEAEPLVSLRDNKGHMLRLTSKHPVIKASSEVVFASTIQKNDRVITEHGITSIVSATRVPYSGQVYNLRLGTPEEQAKAGKNGTTLFAGGFLVGDSAMQREHDQPYHSIAQLPRGWERDYQNALLNEPSIRRNLR